MHGGTLYCTTKKMFGFFIVQSFFFIRLRNQGSLLWACLQLVDDCSSSHSTRTHHEKWVCGTVAAFSDCDRNLGAYTLSGSIDLHLPRPCPCLASPVSSALPNNNDVDPLSKRAGHLNGRVKLMGGQKRGVCDPVLDSGARVPLQGDGRHEGLGR